jgi:broad specificity phosphatase PhoE
VKLYLVRHGQSTGNIGVTLMGQSDHPLTALGEEQARAAAARLAPFGPMPVYSSDLPRARATAEFIVAGWAAGDAGRRAAGAVFAAPNAITLEPRLREIDLGDYEGRPWEEFEADTALTAAFADDPYGTALPNGESLAHLEARVHAAVCDILAAFGLDDSGDLCANAVTNADASAAAAGTCALATAGAAATGLLPVEHGESACIVAHDGPVRAILNHYLGVPPQKWWTLSTTHGGVSLLEFAGGCVTIRFVNATAHLDGLERDASAPAEPDDEPAPG